MFFLDLLRGVFVQPTLPYSMWRSNNRGFVISENSELLGKTTEFLYLFEYEV